MRVSHQLYYYYTLPEYEGINGICLPIWLDEKTGKRAAAGLLRRDKK